MVLSLFHIIPFYVLIVCGAKILHEVMTIEAAVALALSHVFVSRWTLVSALSEINALAFPMPKGKDT